MTDGAAPQDRSWPASLVLQGVRLACLQHPHCGGSACVSSAQGVLSLVASELVFALEHSLTPLPVRQIGLAGTDGLTVHGCPSPAALLLEMLYASVWFTAPLGIGGVWGLGPAMPCTQPGSEGGPGPGTKPGVLISGPTQFPRF